MSPLMSILVLLRSMSKNQKACLPYRLLYSLALIWSMSYASLAMLNPISYLPMDRRLRKVVLIHQNMNSRSNWIPKPIYPSSILLKLSQPKVRAQKELFRFKDSTITRNLMIYMTTMVNLVPFILLLPPPLKSGLHYLVKSNLESIKAVPQQV